MGKNSKPEANLVRAIALEKMHMESLHEEPSEETGSSDAVNLVIVNLLDARWGHVQPER